MKLAKRLDRIKPSATLTISAKAKALKKQGVHIVNFGVGEPDFDTPEHVQEAAIKAMREGHTRYTAVSGIDELKDAVCRLMQRDYGLSYSRDNVLISCGGKHALYNLFQAIIDPGDEVIIPAPYWVSYPDIAELAEGRVVPVQCKEENGFKLRPEDLESVITPRTKLLVMNSPSNPTGAFYSRSDLEGLAEVLARHDHVMIVSDDIYYRILFGGARWVNLAMVDERVRGRTFVVNGVSKSACMTGWRIGYLVGDADVIKGAGKIQGQSTSNPTSIAQWASVAALNGDHGFGSGMAGIFERRCDYVMTRLGELPGVKCFRPQGAFYVFPNFSAYFGRSAGGRVIDGCLDLADYFMEEAHVAAVPGSAFGEERCLRFSYALSMEEIKEGFDRIAEALKSLK